MGKLLHDRRGAALTEFALIAPVLMLLLIGAFDIAHGLYLRSALQGAMQKVSRDSTLEAGATAEAQLALDADVRNASEPLTFGREVLITRRFYRTFGEASAALEETYNDTNGNRTCDAGESFEDRNANGAWDRDGADAGQGFAFDKAVYTASVTYPRLFPLWRFIGGESEGKVEVRTVLMNQPYTGQKDAPTPKPGVCNV